MSAFDISSLTVIYAEDELVFQEISTPVIMEAGVAEANFKVCQDGAEALSCLMDLQGGPVGPIIMLLDMRMPVLDGQQCAEQVQAKTSRGELRRVPYLVCCSAGVDRASFKSLGDQDRGATLSDNDTFDVVLPKPFTNKEVTLVLKKAQEWWLAVGQSLQARGGGGGGRAPWDVSTIDIVVQDNQPICRMSVITALEKQGAPEDDVIECDHCNEVVSEVQNAQSGDPTKPLMVFLGNSSPDALEEIKNIAKGAKRKPFLVCSSVTGDSRCASDFDVMMSKDGKQEAEIKKALEKCEEWWSRQ